MLLCQCACKEYRAILLVILAPGSARTKYEVFWTSFGRLLDVFWTSFGRLMDGPKGERSEQSSRTPVRSGCCALAVTRLTAPITPWL
ncbi:hypothetical protein CB643_18710 [Salmonella enterica subsp. enterica]|nr:hypothetical protein [Salmonella enterica]EBV1115070.1 hypothetical protein [Salmonella enterica subsp. enterica serovar Poona]EBK9345790.1 hypothetical protein [Salmonella enterica]EBL8441240.1 hypothetical protein [Salmonella enterica]EBY8140132.1 hypothetical protein [Salmonella enterica subsp. enterica serovar Poona]